MKNRTVSLLLALFSLSTLFSQNQILNIGKLKLYSPVSTLVELGYDSNPRKIRNWDQYYHNVYKNYSGNKIFEIIADSISSKNMIIGFTNPKVRFFYITQCNITSNLTLNGVELIFYNGELISISCQGKKELSDALDLKYGTAKVEVTKEDHTFTFINTGGSIVKTDETYISVWNSNVANVICKNTLKKWYDKEGIENFSHIFKLCDIPLVDEVELFEKGCKDRFINRMNEKKKESLSDF